MKSPRPILTTAPKPPVSVANRFLDLVGDDLAQTEEVFQKHLRSDVPFIADAGEYIFAGGGKRVRPALLLLIADLLGVRNSEAITYGAVVELIHTATLIHDDIIDDADIRRGQPTVNHRWGNSRTVLLGDWVFSSAMKLALSHGRIEAVDELCDATLRMTEGELLALDRLGAIELSREEYFSIIFRKTANLFASACTLPCLIANPSPQVKASARKYGESLGLCFQLVDDLLDYTARESELGKPVLSDLKEGRLTLPLLLALPRVKDKQRSLVAQVLEDRAFNRVSPNQILEIVNSEGTLEETRDVALGYAREARESLGAFPRGPAREALESAPDFVLHRRH